MAWQIHKAVPSSVPPPPTSHCRNTIPFLIPSHHLCLFLSPSLYICHNNKCRGNVFFPPWWSVLMETTITIVDHQVRSSRSIVFHTCKQTMIHEQTDKTYNKILLLSIKQGSKIQKISKTTIQVTIYRH